MIVWWKYIFTLGPRGLLVKRTDLLESYRVDIVPRQIYAADKRESKMDDNISHIYFLYTDNVLLIPDSSLM